tara:strand:- start:42 stop:296 length:255 start_codon:yes stop_codon:yes gene_type:complete
MKEIESIDMRQWIKMLKAYGFTDASISRYVGNISDRAVREFAENQNRILSDKNHKALYDWLLSTNRLIRARKSIPDGFVKGEDK